MTEKFDIGSKMVMKWELTKIYILRLISVMLMRSFFKNNKAVSGVVAVLMLIMVVAGGIVGLSYMTQKMSTNTDLSIKNANIGKMTSIQLNILGTNNTSSVTSAITDTFNKKQSDISVKSYTTAFPFSSSKVIGLVSSGTIDVGIVDDYNSSSIYNFTNVTDIDYINSLNLNVVQIGSNITNNTNNTITSPLWAIRRVPSTTFVDRFVSWLQLPEGQQVINQSGY